MPAIVIGADTVVGKAAVTALIAREGEVRAFASDQDAVDPLRHSGAIVAVGDVSDSSHVAAAALNCFTAVFCTSAAADGRVLSFAATPEAVFAGWREAIHDSGVRRVIWVEEEGFQGSSEAISAPELAMVAASGRDPADAAAEIARLDEAERL